MEIEVSLEPIKVSAVLLPTLPLSPPVDSLMIWVRIPASYMLSVCVCVFTTCLCVCLTILVRQRIVLKAQDWLKFGNYFKDVWSILLKDLCLSPGSFGMTDISCSFFGFPAEEVASPMTKLGVLKTHGRKGEVIHCCYFW